MQRLPVPMPPRGLVLVAALVAGLALAPRGTLPAIVAVHTARASPRVAGEAESGSGCPPGMFADNHACVHLEPPDEGEAPMAENAHRERSGRWVLYDQIPRRPDRPADYDAYVYPIPPGLPGGHSVVSGYDLDRPDDAQRRGPTLHAVGHGAVDLPQAKGTPIHMIALDHQQGDAEVVYVGPLFGLTIVTRHTLHEGGGLHDYILLFGHLDAAAPGLAKGTHLRVGDVVGAVGDTGSPELVHLHLEARRVREGVDVAAVTTANGLLAPEVSVVCDPRNVLTLKGNP
ncbi:MAG TPA: M23 family metallopeptidase [Polyangiaceae bacterium]|nr:M23 family metallopeptidase [Polyangiaceae bacterium]